MLVVDSNEQTRRTARSVQVSIGVKKDYSSVYLGMWRARNGEETNEQDDAIRLHRPWAFTVTECTGTPIAGKQGQGSCWRQLLHTTFQK